ncbi:MAG: flippase-like domain-containing protein [Nitrospinae bacterium]|nr:flippase-like domain-containing protein [Nitrospinota bacterium]
MADAAREEKDPPKRGARPWLRWVVSLSVVGLIAFTVDLTPAFAAIGRADPFWIALGLLLTVAEQFVIIAAWGGMMRAKGWGIPFGTLTRISFAGNFLGFAMPSSSGPDLVRVMGLGRYLANVSDGLASLALIRVVSVGVLFAGALALSILFYDRLPQGETLDLIVAGLALGTAAVAGLFLAVGGAFALARRMLAGGRFDRLFRKLEKTHDAYLVFRGNRRALLWMAPGAVAGPVNRVALSWVMAQALGMNLDLSLFLVFVPVIAAVARLPFTVAGLGLREGGYLFLFGLAGVAPAEAVSLSLLVFAMILPNVAIGGAVYWLGGMPSGDADR